MHPRFNDEVEVGSENQMPPMEFDPRKVITLRSKLSFKVAKAEAVKRHGEDTPRYHDFMTGWRRSKPKLSTKAPFGGGRRTHG